MKISLIKVIKFILNKIFLRFLKHPTHYLFYLLFKFNIQGTKNRKLNILILNAQRFGDDLKAFYQSDEINILILNPRFQSIINSIFLGLDKSYLVQDFFDSSNADVRNFLTMLKKILRKIQIDFKLNCILSCSFQYRQDFPIAFACRDIDLNFNVIFKEFMKDRAIEEFTIKYYKDRNFRFVGNKIFLANERLKNILVSANVVKPEQAFVIGSPRFDLIFNNLKNIRTDRPFNKITLFSFLHGSGLVQLKNKRHYFTKDPEEGFYHLFKDVHEVFGELATEYPDINFRIKAKYGGEWEETLNLILKKRFNKGLDEFNNLIFDTQSSAQDLIEQSDAIISFNSTTMLEALALGTPVIMPIFAEASGKYSNTNVFFKEYFNDLDIAFSANELKSKIKQICDGNGYNCEMINKEKIFKDYIHKFDGQSTSRLISELKL